MSSFHRKDLGLAQSQITLFPSRIIRWFPKNFWTQITVFSNENLPQSVWRVWVPTKKLTPVLKWCFETCRVLRDENLHTSVHRNWDAPIETFCLGQSLYSSLILLGGFTSKCGDVNLQQRGGDHKKKKEVTYTLKIQREKNDPPVHFHGGVVHWQPSTFCSCTTLKTKEWPLELRKIP